MPSNLTIQPTKPFKSSRLALPPSPFSPLFPVSPPPPPPPAKDNSPAHTHTHNHTNHASNSTLPIPTPPPEPLNWLWQCHLCNRVYKLGTTRRCLEDGHPFCSGTTTVKRSRKGGAGGGKRMVRHKACASEFDYSGWKAWGVWRRDVVRRVREAEREEDNVVPAPLFAGAAAGPAESRWFGGRWGRKGKPEALKAGKEFPKKDCWGSCDYPSECRWGKQYGVATPTLPPPPPVPQRKDGDKPKASFEDILLSIPEPSPIDAEGDVAMLSPPLSPEKPEVLEEPTKMTSFDDLLESVKRRKRRSYGGVVETPSPLASHPPSPTTVSMADAMDLSDPSAASTTTLEQLEDAEEGLVPSSSSSSSSSSSFHSTAAGEVSAQSGSGHTSLQKALDEFDLEFRRSFGRVAGFVRSGSTRSPERSAERRERERERERERKR